MAGKLAVVTGASSGIGAATAVALGARGYTVVLVARDRSKLEAVAGKLPAGKAVVEALDAADGTAVLAMAERVLAAHGVPDVIVNSAGAGRWKYTEDTTPAEAVQMMGAPYFAAFNTTHAFLRPMLARNSGVIVHVGSPASYLPWPGAAGYTAARWALRGFHEALEQDLRGTGLSTCHVLFGKVSSDYFRNNPESEEHIPALGKLIPDLTPEQCADVIAATIDHPRRVVFAPLMLRLFVLGLAFGPGMWRWLAHRTGRQRRAQVA